MARGAQTTRIVVATLAVALVAAVAVLALGRASAVAGEPPGAPSGAPADPQPTLNVMVFNIEVGGTLVSFDKVVEAIKLSGADVVGIEEAQGHISRLARLLGWPYFSTRFQVVSRYPLVDPPAGHGVYLYVEPQPGKVVALMNVHLPSDPYGPYWVRDGKTAAQVIALEKKVRLPAIQAQLAALPALLAHDMPVFLTGDFNSPSYLDWTPAAIGTRSYDRGKPWPTMALEWPVSKAVVDAGFRDSFRDVYPDPVADPGLTWWAKKPHVAVSDENFGPLDVKDRIDYVYAAGPSVTTASRIVGEVGGPEVSVSVSPWPSDHRGVVSSFDITPATPPVFVAVDRRLVSVGRDLGVTFHAPGGPNERRHAGAGRDAAHRRRRADRRHADVRHRSLQARPLHGLAARRRRRRPVAQPVLGEEPNRPSARVHLAPRVPGEATDRGALARRARRALGLGRRLHAGGQPQYRLLPALGLYTRLDRRPLHARPYAGLLRLRPPALAPQARQVQRLPVARRRIRDHRAGRFQGREVADRTRPGAVRRTA